MPEPEDLEDWKTLIDQGKYPRIDVPNFGDFRPKGWEILDADTWWFVDKTGMDKSGPALSIERFVRQLIAFCKEHPDHGYAIVEEGQFQLYIAAFEPK